MVARTFCAVWLLGGPLALGTARAQLSDPQKIDVGFTALQTRLGIAMPTGAGVSVSQVEAQESPANYRPNTAFFPDKAFTFPSGGSTDPSGHASTVGLFLYGPNSLASGIGVAATGGTITSYDASDWIQGGGLRYGTTNALPRVETNDLQSSSWVGSAGSAADLEILQREDYAIARDDFVAVFALNNGSDMAIPNLMASSYNGITVGLSSGAHSRGTTTIDGAGRTKPDIVVPTTATSWATPTVAGAAALLLETSRTTAGLGTAQTSVGIKSLLLAGATRNESEFAEVWAHSSTQPLDSVYGAGELNIENSYDILVAGPHGASASSLAASTGWDVGTSSASTTKYYFFDLASDQAGGSLTAVLTWNVIVTATDIQPGPGVNYSFSTVLPNLDLFLYQASGFTVGSLLESSVSAVDNVELVDRSGLTAGRYALAVSADTSGRTYGLSWITAVPEPVEFGWVIGGLLVALMVARAGTRRRFVANG